MTAIVDDRDSRIVDPESGALSPAEGRGVRLPGVDPLSDVLRNVRLTSALFFVYETSSPFATPVPRGARFAPILAPRAQEVISYHVLLEGSCWGGLIGESPVRLRAGDVLLIPRGDPYVMASGELRCRSAAVDEPAALEFFGEMAAGGLPLVVRDGGGGDECARMVCGFLGCNVLPFNPVVAALPPFVHLTAEAGWCDARLRGLIDYALAELRDSRPGSDGILARLGEILFVEVVRKCLGATRAAPGDWLAGLHDPVVGRCLRLLHARPAANWTVEDLAARVGASRSGLAERFVEVMGQSPIQYLTSWRMQLAANLLHDSGAKVAAVAERVGYGSAAALSRAFKRAVGETPTDWRRRSRSAAGSRSTGSRRAGHLRPAALRAGGPGAGKAP